MSLGDLEAQVASTRLAAARFSELADKYSIRFLQRCIERIRARTTSQILKELAKIPSGVYTAEDAIDADTAGGPYPVRVSVTIADGAFSCDFTGSSAQLESPLNCSRTALISAVRLIFKAIVGPELVLNEGVFQPIEVICPDRTVFTAERPAAVSLYWEALIQATDLVWRALAPVVPERVTAGHFLSLCCALISGPHPDTNELFILFEPNAGGWGAGRGKDGESGLVSIGDGETYMIPVEVAEQKYGVLVDRYALSTVGGGAGEWRGGAGLVKDYRITADRVSVTVIIARHQNAAWGADGGLPGTRNECQILYADGRPPETMGMVSRCALTRGDVVRIITGSGGGWGNPLDRSIPAVVADVQNEYVTREQAREIYGVILDRRLAVDGITDERAARHGDTNELSWPQIGRH